MKFKNVNFPDHIAFTCKSCGRCCTEQPADVNPEERESIEKMGFADFLDENDLSEPRLIRSRKSGGCWFLTENNSCKVHEAKPAICRLVPFVVVDWDYKQNLIEVDLPADCDCPGISTGNELPCETLYKAAQTFVHNQLLKVAKETNLPLDNPKVLSETRKHIIKAATDAAL